jgi:drug/metabolite transporter (DMT)-like permease
VQQRIWAGVLVASFGWGTGGVVSRMALADGATPYEIALARAVLAGIGVVVYLAVRRRLHRPDSVVWRVGIVMALSNLAVPFVLGNIALQYASAGFVALPTALIPLITAALAHVFLPGERLDVAKTLGLLVALAGVVVLLASGDSGLDVAGRPLVAGSLGLVSAITIAAGTIYAKRYAGSYTTLDVAGTQFVLGAIIVAAVALVAGDGVGTGPRASWPELAYLAVATTFVPFTVYYWLIRRVTATYASVIGYVVPLIAVVTGVILLDEQIQPGILLGGLLILGGVVITDRLEHQLRPPSGGRRSPQPGVDAVRHGLGGEPPVLGDRLPGSRRAEVVDADGEAAAARDPLPPQGGTGLDRGDR